MWLDVRAGVIINQDHSSGVTHTVAIHNDESGGFRLYDSDSEARSQGTYERVRADELNGGSVRARGFDEGSEATGMWVPDPFE